MTEKINGQGFRPVDTAGTRRSETAKATAPRPERPGEPASPSARSEDAVKLTPAGLLLSRLEEAVNRAPVVDAERVATIKSALASGSYEIDDQRVANQMLKFERELPG